MRRFPLLVVAYFSFNLGLASNLAASEREPLLIATYDYLPFSSINLPYYGYVNHLVAEAYKRMNVEVRFESVPWARSYKDTSEGKYAATSFWYADPRHNELFIIGPRVTNERLVFFKLKKTKLKDWTNYEDLVGLRIGLTRGYTYTAGMWAFADKHKNAVSIVNTDANNLKMVMLERIDLFPVGELTGWSTAHQIFPPSHIHLLDTVDKELASMSGHLLFPKILPESKQRIQLLSEGLAQLERDGTVDQLKTQLISGFYKIDDKK